MKYVTSASGIASGSLDVVNVSGIDRSKHTFHIQFTNSPAVETQNEKFFAFDGLNSANQPSGVTTYGFAYGATSGATAWQMINGSGNSLSITPSGGIASRTTHDYYVSVSASPNSVGAKTQFALKMYLEYF